jgi:hypothetical protein
MTTIDHVREATRGINPSGATRIGGFVVFVKTNDAAGVGRMVDCEKSAWEALRLTNLAHTQHPLVRKVPARQ